MGHYKSNRRDIEFNLFEFLERGKVLGHGPFEDMDVDTARSVLDEVERLAVEDLADAMIDSDRNPPVFDPATHTVVMPELFKKAQHAFMDSEMWRLDLPVELDGTPAPLTLRWAAQEMILGSNPAIHMFGGGPGFAKMLYAKGTPAQKQLAQYIVDKRWGATMALTEPDAGSDVGAGRTKAVQQPDGTWHLTGVKRFITSAEHDMADNIVHFVLARPEGHGPGTKGLSLFIVPKFLVDADGNLGERNGVFVTNVEHKMGLKASTTCELTFGDAAPAVGTLLGDVHDGIAQMFLIIEMARMMVGTKAIATLSTGYLNALAYAKERTQGSDLTRAMDKTAPKVAIIAHPEVRRSLMLQKSYVEGMRALVLYTASIQDTIYADALEGNPVNADAERLNDLLLPIVKGFGSERSYALLGDALQIFGGSGYLQDYPLEQYIRDAKIDTLYEGTTAIQGMDFFFRKIVRDQGRALTALATEIQTFVSDSGGNAALAAERDLLGRALADVQAIIATMVASLTNSMGDSGEMYKVGQNTTRLLMCAGDLVIGWLLLRQAEVALRALDGSPSARDRAFYIGKVAAARFFAAQVLPQLTAQRLIAESVDNAIMELGEDSF